MPITPRTVAALLVGTVALYLLLVSARMTVQRLVNVAQYYGTSEAVIGLTVVAIGTSLPEIGSHVTASVGILTGGLDYEVASATSLGGSIGSSVTQQTLLVGAFLLGAGRVTVSRAFVRSSYVPMILATALTLTLAADGTISRVDGLLLFGSFLVYVYYTIDRRDRVALPEDMEVENVNPRTDAVIALGGMAVVLASAYVALSVVEVLVETLQLGGSLIGIVTLGVGSALPELTTVSESIRRNRTTLALGTLIGSNVVNPLVAIGLGGAISGYRVPDALIYWDIPVMLAVGVAAYVYVTRVSDGVFRRRDATWFVAAYFGFLAGHLLLFPGQ